MIRFNYQDNLQSSNPFKNKDFISGLLLAFSAIMVIFAVRFLALPLFSSIRSTQTIIKENQTLFKNLEKKQTTLAQLQKISAQTASSSASINEAISNYSDIPLVMSLLEKIDSETIEAQGPLLIESISVAVLPNDLPSNSSSLVETENEIQINFVGDYQAIKDYINQLKILKHNFSVAQISLSAPKSTNLNQLLTVSVKLRYYHFNES